MPVVNAVVPLDKITPHAQNYNAHPEGQIHQLGASYTALGQFRSVVLWQQEDGTYIQLAGHGVVEAMKREGAKEVRADIHPPSLDPLTAKQIMLADNLHAHNSSPDDEMLASLLQEQQNAGFDLAALGTDDEALRQMLAALGDEYAGSDEREKGDGGDDFDTTPEEGPTRSLLGDIWELGRHRLFVGDSSDGDSLACLLDTPIHAVITDPPYSFGLASTSHMATKSGGWHDMMNNASWFVDRYNQWQRLVRNGPLWVFCNWRTLPILMRASFDSKVGIDSVMIWYKDWIGPGGMKGLRPTYEMICFSALGDYTIPDRGIQDFVTVGWSSHKPTGHKAEKPVDLLLHLVNVSQCETIFDPFGGSGTTLIACERTGRIARICEIDPAYADMILRRYEAETGQIATLLQRSAEASHTASIS